MANEGGGWIMRGMSWDDPYRIRTWKELVNWINEIGFLPLFANEVAGFSAEEHISPDFWWTGDREQDPWEWREIIAASHEVAYGKFFDKKAGFISLAWLPCFANCRRNGYDFDARWEDGRASAREKKIMDRFLGEDADGGSVFRDEQILSTDLKRLAGFGRDGEKNFPGIITQLQMETYLVISGFRRRENRRGKAYGMPVSILLPPESIWGYDMVTAAYDQEPKASWKRLLDRVQKLYPHADREAVIRLIGREPEE